MCVFPNLFYYIQARFSRQARLEIKAASKDKTHLHLVLVVFCVYGKGISLLIDCRFEWAIVN
jgi:hypothetical protein